MNNWEEVEREGEKKLILKLADGAEIHDNGADFSAYDSSGRYLGFCGSEEEAAYMASHGYCNITDEAGNLGLWMLWNEAMDSGTVVLHDINDGNREQYLVLPDNVVMGARPGKHGWEVRLLDLQEWWDAYRDETYNMLALTAVEKPYVLE